MVQKMSQIRRVNVEFLAQPDALAYGKTAKELESEEFRKSYGHIKSFVEMTIISCYFRFDAYRWTTGGTLRASHSCSGVYMGSE